MCIRDRHKTHVNERVLHANLPVLRGLSREPLNEGPRWPDAGRNRAERPRRGEALSNVDAPLLLYL
eukprot:14154314-Alexandrium_andersonii.AAC.1